MKHFLIRYRLQNGSQENWHRDIAEFIANLDGDPELAGRIAYRCLRVRHGIDYYHLATPKDPQAQAILQSRDFFARYTAKTRQVSNNAVEVLPLEVVAETR